MSPTPADGVTLSIEGNDIRVTNPDKLLWPEAGITKLGYIGKLIALSPYLLRYCRMRYLTVIRYPNGIKGKHFYQKNAPKPLPPFVHTAYKDKVEYVHLDSLSTLVWLGNLAAVEFHSSFERIGGDEPAEWVLDVDPTDEDETKLMEAVALIGETLTDMGIQSVPKTSGATGVQILVPVKTGYTFEQLHALGGFIGAYLSQKHPRIFTIERYIREREGRIYLDYVQHASGKSLAAPYTPRARKEATVSAPLEWEEVRRGVSPRRFTLLTIEERLRQKGDLLAQATRQSLDPVLAFIGASGGRRSGKA